MGSNSCPICLEDIVGKIKASPDTCDHIFCLPCLEKWSKLGSFCPVDRKRYRKILNLDSSDKIQVKPRKRKKIRVLYDISTSCEICSKDNSPEILLLCDYCDLGFHMCCLSPPLKTVPAGSWICPTCDAVEKKLLDKKGISKEVEVDVIKSEILDSKKNIPEECDQVITDFEAISVPRNCDKNVLCSNILDDTNNFNEIEKILKTVNYETQNCKQNLSKYSKTYNLLNKKKNISKPLLQEQIYKINNRKLQSSNVDDMCLKNNISEDFNLLDQYSFEDGSYGCMKSEKWIEGDSPKWSNMQLQKIDFNEDCKQIEFSGTNSLHPGTMKNTEINPEENVNYSLNEDNLQETYSAIGKSLEEIQRNPEIVKNENAEDLPSLYKSVSENSTQENNFKKIGQYLKTCDYESKDLLSKTCVLNSRGKLCDSTEARFAEPKPSNRSFGEFAVNSNKKQCDKDDILNSIRPVILNIKTEFNSEPVYNASDIYGVNNASEITDESNKFSENSASCSGFKKKSSSDYESAFVAHKDLKFLKILKDGTFFIDKPAPKKDNSFANNLQSSGSSNHFGIFKTFKREEFKYLTILENGTLLLERPTRKKERFETSSFQNSEGYDNCSESESFYRNELKYFTEKRERFQRDNAYKASHYPKNIIHKSDLKYLTINKDGSLILDLPK